MDVVFDSLLNHAYSPLVIVYSYLDLADSLEDTKDSANLVLEIENNIILKEKLRISFLGYDTYLKFENNLWDSQLLESIRANLPSKHEIYNVVNQGIRRAWFDGWALKVCHGLRPNSGPPSARILRISDKTSIEDLTLLLGKMGGNGATLVLVDFEEPAEDSSSFLSALEKSLVAYEPKTKFKVLEFDSSSYLTEVKNWIPDVFAVIEIDYNQFLNISNWDEFNKVNDPLATKRALWWDSKFLKNIGIKIKETSNKSNTNEAGIAVDKRALTKAALLGFSLGKFKEVYKMLYFLSTTTPRSYGPHEPSSARSFDSQDLGGKWFEYLAISNLYMDDVKSALNSLYNSFHKYIGCGYFRRCLWVGIVSIYIYLTRNIKNFDKWTVSNVLFDLQGSSFFSQDTDKDIQMSSHARAALLLEQSAIVYAHIDPVTQFVTFSRRGSVQLILAGHRSTSAELRGLALFCYLKVAKRFFHWTLAFEHILFTMAKQAILMNYFKEGLWHYILLIAFIFNDEILKLYDSTKHGLLFKQVGQIISDIAETGDSYTNYENGPYLRELFETINTPLWNNHFPIKVPQILNSRIYVRLPTDLPDIGDEKLYYGGDDELLSENFFTQEIAFQSALIQSRIVQLSDCDFGSHLYSHFKRDRLKIPDMFARVVAPGERFWFNIRLYNQLDMGIACRSASLVADSEYLKASVQDFHLDPFEEKDIKFEAKIDSEAPKGIIKFLYIKYMIFDAIPAFLPLRYDPPLQVQVDERELQKISLNGSYDVLDAVELYQGQVFEYSIESNEVFNLVLYPPSILVKSSQFKITGKCLEFSGKSCTFRLDTSRVGVFRLYFKFDNLIYQRLISIGDLLQIYEAKLYDHDYLSLRLHNISDLLINIEGIDETIHPGDLKIYYIHRKYLKGLDSEGILNKSLAYSSPGSNVHGFISLPGIVDFSTDITPVTVNAVANEKIIKWDFKRPYQFIVTINLYNFSSQEISLLVAHPSPYSSSRFPYVSHFTGKTVHSIKLDGNGTAKIDLNAVVFKPGTFNISNVYIKIPELDLSIKIPESLIIIH